MDCKTCDDLFSKGKAKRDNNLNRFHYRKHGPVLCHSVGCIFITSAKHQLIYFFIKITVNYNVIDCYINFYLFYNITVFTFVQNFITCKITLYYFNSKGSPFLKFIISLVKQNICALCFILWTFKFFI